MTKGNDMPDGNAVESIRPGRKVRVVERGYHKDHAPTPLGTVDARYLVSAARQINAAVERIQRDQGAGSFVFVSQDREIFVISELRSVAHVWLVQHFGWLVARYAPQQSDGRRRPKELRPTVPGIVEDLAQHMADLRRLA